MSHALRPLAFILAGLVAAPVPALAEDADFRAALAALPATIFTRADQGMVEYVNLAALMGGGDWAEGLKRARVGGEIRPLSALFMSSPAEFSEKSGVDPAQIRFIAGLGQAPNELAIWGFGMADDVHAVLVGLSARGFGPAGMPGFFANGETGAMDLAGADAGNPWSGAMGKTSVVTARGAVLLQGASPAAMMPVLGAAGAADATSQGQVALAALEEGEGQVLQAVILSPAMTAIQLVDPAMVMDGDPARAQARLAEEQARLASGLPLYSGLVIAEVVQAGEAATAAVLTYDSCADAEEAAKRAPALWEETLAPSGVVVEMRPEVVTAEGGCALKLTLTGGEGLPRGTMSFLMDGVWMRNSPILRAGAPASQ